MSEKLGRAVEALRRGEFVIVADDAERENEADLILAAQFATPEKLAFLVRHTSGIVCVPMTDDRADALGLPLMVEENTEQHRTAFTVSVDEAGHTDTGISATDRATTARALADPASTASDFARPGHMFPLRAHPGGIRSRAGHTEAAVELVRLAGLLPVAVISELMTDNGEASRRADTDEFASRHGIPLLEVADLLAHHESPSVTSTEPVPLPTAYGEFAARFMRTEPDGLEHLVLTLGDTDAAGDVPVLVRIHSECATGDIFGSRRCDCGEQLQRSLAAIHDEGRGILVYEKSHEGRGIGLADKLRAYRLQDLGADTVDANLRLGHPADGRDFSPAARVLRRLGVTHATLLTNNPQKLAAVAAAGIAVQRRELQTAPLADNLRYLGTKQARLGHDLAIQSSAIQAATAGRR